MSMRENDVADWLRRQHARKRDHHEALRRSGMMLS
jgi:hypothetical protein